MCQILPDSTSKNATALPSTSPAHQPRSLVVSVKLVTSPVVQAVTVIGTMWIIVVIAEEGQL